ncbi:transposase [Candidatus Dependentiae bacterium]|nr:transposase [Candidatus Dependentiae bacterium]
MKKRYKRTHSGWMRRTSRIYIRDANKLKIEELVNFLNLHQNIVNYSIVRFWSSNDIDENFPPNEVIKSIQERFNITARLAQCVSKQAKEMIRSQNEKSERRMPRFTSHIANLDSRFVSIEPFDGHFEMCLKFASGVPKLLLPFNWTKHTNKFRNNEWELAKSIRLGYNNKGLFIDLFFEKEPSALRSTGKTIGVDLGFNTMLVTSDGQFIGGDLKETIKKGGKRRKSWHHFITTEANRYLKELNLTDIKVISLENLSNVKKGKRGKFSRNVNRLLSFWFYAKVSKRLTQICEEQGTRIDFKNPWKTSQRCSVCGNIDRRNRKGEKFLCLECGHEANADYNASKNLETLGLAEVYSLRSLPNIKGDLLI